MKKLLLLLSLLLLLFLAGCSQASIKEQEGICIFNENENIKTNFLPEKNVHIKEIYNSYSSAAIIKKNGAINIMTDDFYIGSNGSIIGSNGSIIKGKTKINNIEGIYLTDNYHSITEAYYKTEEYLSKNEKIMVVLLDGFSYNQYKVALEKFYIPFLSKYFKYPALSVFTPVTNSGYAAIITGKYPDENGIHDRSTREMNVKSIFEYTLKHNKNTIFLEGDIKILNTEIEPVLHVDINKDGDTDDEMYESAMKASNENYDFIFIHFHGIDDRGHIFGPYAKETMEYINTIDTYLYNISKIWDGAMIFVPDHGMHEYEKGGNHGICIQSDMVVPYFIKEK